MGIDADILVRINGKPKGLWLPDQCELEEDEELAELTGLYPTPTHRVECPTRYFGPIPSFDGLSVGEARDDHYIGNWPMLCSVLLSLLANKRVSHVWYGSLLGDGVVGMHLVTPGDVLHLTRIFLAKNTDSELEPDDRQIPRPENGPKSRAAGH